MDQQIESRLLWVDIDKIAPDPNQPRKDFDKEKLNRLARTVGKRGTIQHIVVRPSSAEGIHTLVVGERRFRAARIAGLDRLQVLVRDITDEDELLVLQLIENLGEGVRVGLSLHERAEALKRLVGKFGDQRAVADELGITQAWVSYNLAVLDLSPAVEALREKGIVKDCKVLTSLEKLNKSQPEAAAELIEQAEAEGKFPKAALKTALADAGLVKPRKGGAAIDAPDLAPKIERAARRLGVSPEPGALFRFLLDKYLAETEGEA